MEEHDSSLHIQTSENTLKAFVFLVACPLFMSNFLNITKKEQDKQTATNMLWSVTRSSCMLLAVYWVLIFTLG